MKQRKKNRLADGKQAEEEKIPDVPSSDVPQGVLPRIIATLVNRRRQVKALMKDKSSSPAKLLQVCHSLTESLFACYRGSC